MSGWASAQTLRMVLTPGLVMVVAIPFAVAGFVATQAASSLISTGISPFFTNAEWAPTEGKYGAGPLIAGTLVSSAGAMAVVAPAAIGWALRINLFASAKVAALERAMVATLAGVPSVVFGLVGLITLVPLIRSVQPPGLSLLAASVVLAAMCFPTTAIAADAAIQAVDRAQIVAARALGLGAWDTARVAVLPAAKAGLSAACLLGLGRALGETLAVMMVAGNTVAWPSMFAPFRTLNGNIAVEMAYSAGMHRSALFVTGLIMLVVVVLTVGFTPPSRTRTT